MIKSILTKFLVTGTVIGLLAISPIAEALAKNPDVQLTKNDMWANGNDHNCQQIAVYGNVSSKSKKKVSFVIEYRGNDSCWHYDKWYGPYSAGTNVPTLNSSYMSKCDMRLQLNPYGTGDSGKGGVATGYVNVVK